MDMQGNFELFDFSKLLILPMNHKKAFNELVGNRVRLVREEAGVSQTVLAEKLGVSSHQIISQIETGVRALNTDEMLTLSELFDRSMDFFTDPYQIVDQSVMSFRARSDSAGLEAFEARMQKLVSAVLRFSELSGAPVNAFKQQLPLNSYTTVYWACEVGSRIAGQLKLGAIPADNLEAKIEKELGIRVLRIDAPEGISGTACHLPQIDLIAINRNEPDFRQNFDLAHELFHVVTWSTLPPERYDWTDNKKPKAEKLADAFASGLLMPRDIINARWAAKRESDEIHDWILANATEMKVSGDAFYWRLVGEGLLKGKAKDAVDRSRLSRSAGTGAKPRLFSESFVRSMHNVLKKGLVSVRKASDLIDLDVDELDPLFASYGLDSPV